MVIEAMKVPDIARTDMGAGHGEASDRYDRLQEAAFDGAFDLRQMSIARKGAGEGPGS